MTIDCDALLRQYAEDRLGDSGEADAIRARHSAYYLGSLRDVRPRLEGASQIDALRDIDSDLEYRLHGGGNEPIVFVPDVNVGALEAPSIIDDF